MNRVELFYEGLTSDKFKTEKEAVRYFFKTYDPKDPGYLKLKNKLVHQLVNTAFFVDINQASYNERAKAYYTAYKDFAAATILMTRYTGKSGIYMCQLVLEQAIKYEFIELAADVSRMLRKEYARIGGDIEKNKYYTNLYHKYEKKRYYENLASDYHETLVSYYVTNRSPNKEIHCLAIKYFNELFPLIEAANTSTFISVTYNIGIIKYSSINDVNSAMRLCDEALGILKHKVNTNRSTLVNFTIQKIAFYTQLRYDDNAVVKDLFHYCLNILEEGDFNWFRIHEVYFYHCIYSSFYGEDLEVYRKIIKVENFQFLAGIFHDNWLLLGGYLHLLAKLGALDPSEVENIVGPFRYSKLFNDIEVLKKDKEGMNIPLILLPVLMLLSQKPSERSKEIPIEALEKYRQRWLANDMNRRSNSFLKLLIAFSQKDYSATTYEKKIKKELDILKSETPQVAGQNFAVEIIPYETLWELLNNIH